MLCGRLFLCFGWWCQLEKETSADLCCLRFKAAVLLVAVVALAAVVVVLPVVDAEVLAVAVEESPVPRVVLRSLL